MKKILILSLLLMISLSCQVFSQCQYGDPCMEINSNCLDSSYSVINEFVTSGVQGGIPNNLPVVSVIDNTDDIQIAIDNAANSGGGVVILSAGTYSITSTLYMKSNVIIRGVDNNTTILESTIRSTWSQGKKNTIEFNNTSNSGIENITVFYKVDGYDPIDRENWLDGGWCGDCFKNNPHNINDLYVRQIAINSNSNNCWVDSCKILNSGTDPILLAGNYNTLQNNYIDRCYNKGGSGNGYYDIRGDYNLITNETVKRIRHFTIQIGAAYNVIIDCYIEGDVNFHNGDDGNNLLENNEIKLPTWHGWDIFATGGAQYGHQPPGPNNIIVNNTTNYKNQGPKYANPNTIYTFTDYGQPDTTNWSMPICNTFYPMIELILSIHDNVYPSKRMIYPNPTEDKFVITNGDDLLKDQIKVYNLIGQQMSFKQKNLDNKNIEIDISNLNTGIYFVKTKTITSKVYKQ